MSATVTINDQRQLYVSGAVTMFSVKKVCAAGKLLLRDLDKVSVDLSGITNADSSCLAMLIDWIRSAREQHKTIEFNNAPRVVLELGRVCGLDQILPLGKELAW